MKLRNRRKLTQPQRESVRRYLSDVRDEWRFAKSMPQWPHWYVLRGADNPRGFDSFEKVIQNSGYDDAFGKRTDSYLVIGRFKYWILGDVLNRAEAISNAEMKRRGQRWLRRHGKVVGPYGRPISAKQKTLSAGRSK